MKCWITKEECYETSGIQCKAFNYESQCVDKINVYIIELQDKLSRRNMQIKELKKGVEHLNKYYSQAERFIESKKLGVEWREFNR